MLLMVCKAIFIVHVFYTIMLESLTQKKQCFMYVFDYDLFRMVIKNACHNLSLNKPSLCSINSDGYL